MYATNARLTQQFSARTVHEGDTVQVIAGSYTGKIGTCVHALKTGLLSIETSHDAPLLYLSPDQVKVITADSHGMFTPGILVSLRAECGL